MEGKLYITRKWKNKRYYLIIIYKKWIDNKKKIKKNKYYTHVQAYGISAAALLVNKTYQSFYFRAPSMEPGRLGENRSTLIDMAEEQREPLLHEDGIIPCSSSDSPDASTRSPANSNQRLASLDVFRGLTVAVRTRSTSYSFCQFSMISFGWNIFLSF